MFSNINPSKSATRPKKSVYFDQQIRRHDSEQPSDFKPRTFLTPTLNADVATNEKNHWSEFIYSQTADNKKWFHGKSKLWNLIFTILWISFTIEISDIIIAWELLLLLSCNKAEFKFQNFEGFQNPDYKLLVLDILLSKHPSELSALTLSNCTKFVKSCKKSKIGQ